MPRLLAVRPQKRGVIRTISAWIPAFAGIKRSIAALRYLVGRGAKKKTPARHSDALMQAFAPADVEFKHISFTFAIISLAAKIAHADGGMTRESYIAFRDAFPLSGGLCPKLRKLFVLACNDATPMEHYAQQVKYSFPRNLALFEALVERMFFIASAQPPMGRRQEHMLAKLAHTLELSPATYAALHEKATTRKPHHVLGTGKKASASQVKRRYYQLMQRYHPDRYANETLSPEVAQLLSLRTAEISAAYRALVRKAA